MTAAAPAHASGRNVDMVSERLDGFLSFLGALLV